VRAGGELLWESLTTIYYRGRFGEAGVASALSKAPEVSGDLLAQWHTSPGAGWRFGRLTGDYNGVHWSRRYARMFGFRRDFQHPQLALGQCMARLRAFDPAGAERLDAWLKGPVYYDSDASLRATTEPDGAAFALNVEGEDRPAVVGRYSAVARGSTLLA
jgi:acyl dehydratase